MKNAVQVTVLGQPFTVRTEASPDEVYEVAACVNKQVAEIMAGNHTTDTLNAAVLALMNMTGDYLRTARKLRQLQARLETTAAFVSAGEEG